MKTTLTFLLALAALVVAGCSSGGTSAGGDGGETSKPTGGGEISGIAVSNCLINEDFLVQPSESSITGTSPGGVSFELRFYKDEDAAKAVYEKKDKKTTALTENAVVDFKGNPSPYEGAPPAKISQKELRAISLCIDKSRGDE